MRKSGQKGVYKEMTQAAMQFNTELAPTRNSLYRTIISRPLAATIQ